MNDAFTFYPKEDIERIARQQAIADAKSRGITCGNVAKIRWRLRVGRFTSVMASYVDRSNPDIRWETDIVI